MIKLTELKSSNIAAAGHDPSTNVLAIRFHSGHGVHHYKDVPADVANGLIQAESAGRYFQSQIRGQYDHEPVMDEPAQA